MAPRRITVADVLVERERPRRTLIELADKMAEPDREAGSSFRLKKILATDAETTMAMFRIGRLMNEDYPKLGDYIAALMGVFDHARYCGVYLLPRVANGSTGELEHRASVIRNSGYFEVYGSGEADLIAPNSSLARLRNTAFVGKHPMFFDYDRGLKLVFDDLDMNNKGCTVHEFEPSTGAINTGSLALMPFHYRDPSAPSGIVLLEGDLGCRGSKLAGVERAFWGAHAAVEAASQIVFMIIQKFDAITTLAKYVDFNADLTNAVRKIVLGDLKDVWVLLIDLDDLKRLNNRSYQDGNKELRRLAETAKASIRPEDMIARWGGDEFAGVIKGVGKAKALEIAERIRRNFSNGPVTCSIGVASVDEVVSVEIERMSNALGTVCLTRQREEEMVETVFTNANIAVQTSKQQGKDRVYYIENDAIHQYIPSL